MATILSITRPGVSFRPHASNVWILYWLVRCQRKSTNVGSVDSFISDLVENKTLKWKVLNGRHRNAQPKVQPQLSSSKPPAKMVTPTERITRSSFRFSQLFNELTNNPLVVNISQMEVSQVDHLVGTALKEENVADIKLLLEQILQYKKLPSVPIQNAIMKHLAQRAETEKLDQLITLCSDGQTAGGPIGRYEHYRALCQWKLGNTLNSLEAFRAIMVNTDEEHLPQVDHMLLDIIDETIGKKSEAVLLAVMALCEFCLQELRHDFPICYVWEKSFMSAWHSDQEAAKTLFDRHKDLREAISKRIRSLCYNLLYENNVEHVYKMIEMFLKHDMKEECRTIMIRLYEYQYWRKNLRGCSEIMQNAIDLNISLPEVCNLHLLELLLGRNSVERTQRESSKMSKALKPNKYELKF